MSNTNKRSRKILIYLVLDFETFIKINNKDKVNNHRGKKD